MILRRPDAVLHMTTECTRANHAQPLCMIQKGQVLFELDPRPFEADVGRAKDQLAVEQAQLVSAQKEEARLKDLPTQAGPITLTVKQERGGS